MSRTASIDAAGPTTADRARYADALAAAADPERGFDAILETFARLRAAMCAGDRAGAAAAARELELHCVQLCVAPTASAAAAEDRRRVAEIIIGWAWPRRPALAAVLTADNTRETQCWGAKVAGEA